jgi:hypothetical protein
MENVVIFYDHSEHFTAIWYNLHMAFWYSLWSFGEFFPLFGMLYREKSGNSASDNGSQKLETVLISVPKREEPVFSPAENPILISMKQIGDSSRIEIR